MSETIKYTSQDIAERIGITREMVEEWSETFNVPHRKQADKYVFPERSLHILIHIKQLKDEADGLNTIRRKIGDHISMEELLPSQLVDAIPGTDELPFSSQLEEKVDPLPDPVLELKSQHTQPSVYVERNLDENQSGWQQNLELQSMLNDAVITGLNKHNDLAEKYAQATFVIGQQQERIKALESQLSEIKEAMKDAFSESENDEKRPFWKKLKE